MVVHEEVEVVGEWGDVAVGTVGMVGAVVVGIEVRGRLLFGCLTFFVKLSTWTK